ncbi:MAG: hypothetical protein ACTSU5_20340 [Promethearchaeota archaeon]
MKPPICAICHERFDPINGGGLVYFKERPSDIEWRERMKEKGMVGHPPYAAWFCNKSLERARELSHLTISEAMPVLREEFE